MILIRECQITYMYHWKHRVGSKGLQKCVALSCTPVRALLRTHGLESTLIQRCAHGSECSRVQCAAHVVHPIG